MKRVLLSIIICVCSVFHTLAFHDLVNASIAQLDLNEKRIVEKWVRDSISPKDTTCFLVAIPMEREQEPGVCDLLIVQLSRPRRDLIRSFTDSAKVITKGLNKTTGLKFDFGNYNLNDTTRAFGIRVKDSMQTNMYLSKTETLTLYVPKDSSMVKVMDNMILNSVNDQWNLMDCEGDHIEERRIVIMDRRNPNADMGYRDIMVKNRVASIKNFLNPNAKEVAESDSIESEEDFLAQVEEIRMDSTANEVRNDSLPIASDSLTIAQDSAIIATTDSIASDSATNIKTVEPEKLATTQEPAKEQQKPEAKDKQKGEQQKKNPQKRNAVIRYSNGVKMVDADPENLIMHSMMQDISQVNLDSLANMIMAEREKHGSMDGETLDQYKIEQYTTNSDCIEATTIEWMREFYEFKDGLYRRSKRLK